MTAHAESVLEQQQTSVRRHIAYKATAGELDRATAEKMLTALDDGAVPDYQKLLELVMFTSPPPVCFHTAPVSARAEITAEGLRPGTGVNWNGLAHGQPAGVYVGPAPDTRGIWSHWEAWDVWAVDMAGLEEGTGPGQWSHDRLNPGCWVIHGTVPTDRVQLHAPDLHY